MFKNNIFFNFSLMNSSNYNKNVKKTKKIFKIFLEDLESEKIPVLSSFDKAYEYDFSKSLIKKFSKYNNIIIFGMGGSVVGTKAIYSFMKKKVKKKIFFFDNLDPNLNSEYNKIKNIKNSCFIAVSKSGNTFETIVNLSAVFSKSLLSKKLIIITEIKDSALLTVADKYGAEVIEHKEFIGGRYSVLSEVGMFPAALMKLNLSKFKNLKNLIKNKNFSSTLINNVANIYTLNQKKINNSVILNYDSSLNDLGYWYQQLIGESLGKKGKGINPMMSFGPKDHHSLLQLYLDGPNDKFFTFFTSSKKENTFKTSRKAIPNEMKFLGNKSLNSIIDAQFKATKNIFKIKKIPFRQINFTQKNEEELGTIFTFFVLETILLSRLMKLNPFNQPAVEQVKIETKKLLK